MRETGLQRPNQSGGQQDLTYRSFTAKGPHTFVFHPYALKENNNRWFTCGQRHARSGIQNLALDRIISLASSKSVFVDRPDFNPEVWFSDVIGVTKSASDKPQRIVFTATATQTPYIKTKPLHSSQQLLEEYPNGFALFEINVIVNNELLRVLLGFGCGIKVLEPESLANQIKKNLEESVRQY